MRTYNPIPGVDRTPKILAHHGNGAYGVPVASIIGRCPIGPSVEVGIVWYRSARSIFPSDITTERSSLGNITSEASSGALSKTVKGVAEVSGINRDRAGIWLIVVDLDGPATEGQEVPGVVAWMISRVRRRADGFRRYRSMLSLTGILDLPRVVPKE
jgi:hypothetical protein